MFCNWLYHIFPKIGSCIAMMDGIYCGVKKKKNFVMGGVKKTNILIVSILSDVVVIGI